MSYQEYPKHMAHPAFQPAVVAKWDPKIKDPAQQVQGKPTRFPPVVVHNFDQEQEYASKGYKPNGVSDPEAYRRQMTGNLPKPDGSEKEYPKMLYKAADNEEGYTSKIVNNKAEEQALGKGWHRTPGDAKKASQEPEKAEAPAAAQASQAASGEERQAPAEVRKEQAEKKPVKAKKPGKKAKK